MTRDNDRPGRIDVTALRERLVAHPLYQHLTDPEAVRTFMRSHVFCVWDFQSLLTALQRSFTCVEIPWRPVGDGETRRLVNEIVLEEESDEHPDGGYASHFEVYLEAMRDAGADAIPIERLLAGVARGHSIQDVLAEERLPPGAAGFVDATFETIRSEDPHRLVAVFTHAREDLIPEMFRAMIARLGAADPARWRKLAWYLNRHVEVDGERHGPISHALLARVCGNDPQLWQEAQESVERALAARLALWDALTDEIRSARPRTVPA